MLREHRSSYALKKDFEQAEIAFKKALELDPNSIDSFNGLATIYNDQKKFPEAQAMSAEASKRASVGGGESADTLYNQVSSRGMPTILPRHRSSSQGRWRPMRTTRKDTSCSDACS